MKLPFFDTNSTQQLELGEEYPLPEENKAIDRIAEISEAQIRRVSTKPAPRDQHFKQHGCVWAQFIVADNLPENLRVGVFKEPKTFPAWIRFSNSRAQDDSKAAVHGMSIKVMEVEGEKVLEKEKTAKTQDFVLIDYPIFFIRNLQDYVDFQEKLEKSLGKPPLNFFFPSLNLHEWHWHEFVTLVIGMEGIKRIIKIASPLETQYWSTTPYRFGLQAIRQSWSTTPDEPRLQAVKFFVKPSDKNKLNMAARNTENYLREAMVEHLTSRKKEACFDFYVQLQTDPSKTPIEDSTIEWRDAKEYKVATIKIPPQVFDSPEQMEFSENLSFTPWHCLPEHMPLGGINRSRNEIYQRTSKLRHELNQAPRMEPTPETFKPQLFD